MKNGKYDPAVGVSEIKKVGTQVKQGATDDPLQRRGENGGSA